MFTSIKSKIIIITLGIFAVFNVATFSLELNNYNHYKQIKLEALNNQMDKFQVAWNTKISQMENNARCIAMASSGFYYFTNRSQDKLDFLIENNFKNNYLIADGGGIFFEPYKVNHGTKRFCSYASGDNKKVELDIDCDSDSYNYLMQPWYLMTKNSYQPEEKNTVYWTKPYRDEIGTKDVMITATAPIYDTQNQFIGMVGEDWLLEQIINELDNLQLPKNSITVLADSRYDYIIAVNDGYGKKSKFIGKSLNALSWYDETILNKQTIKIGKKDYIAFIKPLRNGMVFIANIPTNAIFGHRKHNMFFTLILQMLSALLFAIIIYSVLIKNINKPILTLMDAANKIGQGDFDSKIDLTEPKEFARLANTVNTMTGDIKNYLENIQKLNTEKKAIESDLNIAKEIQTSSLPSVFPPFPDIISVDLYANMKTAKQVGGDFYDFYFINKDHIAFTIADVSGKGVPAALFMMRANSVLKSTAMTTSRVEAIMSKVNNSLCEDNSNGYFVTVGLGVINILTGEVTYINAGHNPPIIKTSNEVKYLTPPQNIVLGIFKDMDFEIMQFKLNPLDTIFLYTDGVTEANNKDMELYAEDRLLKVLNTDVTKPQTLINMVSEDVNNFVGEMEQADDMTMLAITYLGQENIIQKLHVPAEVKKLDEFMSWLENLCQKCGANNSEISKMLVCAEEIFVNIAYYAYPDELKKVIQETLITFKYIKPLNEIVLTFADSGIPYNPLAKEDPDINLGLEERGVGGLGIYMVKNMMDNVEYEYKNKQNVLTLTCKL